MDIAIIELESIKAENNSYEQQRIVELEELQLTLIGGGIGDTCR
jgi:NADPH-dependent 7-cyano-7-deazaguanine reductase QueF-like protein